MTKKRNPDLSHKWSQLGLMFFFMTDYMWQ